MKEIRSIEDGTKFEAMEVGGGTAVAVAVCGLATSMCLARGRMGTHGARPRPGRAHEHGLHDFPMRSMRGAWTDDLWGPTWIQWASPLDFA